MLLLEGANLNLDLSKRSPGDNAYMVEIESFILPGCTWPIGTNERQLGLSNMVVDGERHGELGRSSFECRSETFRVAEAFRQSPADHPGVAYRSDQVVSH